MDKRITDYIDSRREDMIATLIRLIESPSPDKGDTEAQEIVQDILDSLGFETERFMGSEDLVGALADYSPPGIEYSSNVFNVAGKRKGSGTKPSLMLFSHIDTEAEDCWGDFPDPFAAKRESGRIFGLGAADDKGGVAMMLEAVRTAMHFRNEFDYDLTVMSILGKHGGAFGTLSALVKGYTGENSIYLHPAETGHGFREIKNISLGVADFDLTVRGLPGEMHDDLSEGLNANLVLAKAILWLDEYNQKIRNDTLFDFGSFKGKPSFLLNVGTVRSEGGYGDITQKASCKIRCRFFNPRTPESVYKELVSFLDGRFRSACPESDWELKPGDFKATPVMIDNDHPFVKLVEDCITEVTGRDDFIHQYHGGSDIRLPMLYGKSNCVGIGPSCILPEKGSGQMEWIDEEDYITGIKILTDLLLSY